MTNQFIKESVQHWYLPLIIGIILIGTGIWTFSSPASSYLALTLIFSMSFLFSGILEAFFAIANRKEMENWGWTLVIGIMTALVGIMLLRHPEISLISLPLYVGFMMMFRSIGAIGLSMDLKNYGVMEWGTLMIIGILALIFSTILIWNPVFGGMSIVFWTGVALFLGGAFNIYLSFKMKNLHKNWDSVSAEAKEKLEEAQQLFQKEFGK